jgi:hypothetical protein
MKNQMRVLHYGVNNNFELHLSDEKEVDRLENIIKECGFLELEGERKIYPWKRGEEIRVIVDRVFYRKGKPGLLSFLLKPGNWEVSLCYPDNTTVPKIIDRLAQEVGKGPVYIPVSELEPSSNFLK